VPDPRRRRVERQIGNKQMRMSNQVFLVIYHCCLRTKNVIKDYPPPSLV
jgi:hypothetical protein